MSDELLDPRTVSDDLVHALDKPLIREFRRRDQIVFAAERFGRAYHARIAAKAAHRSYLATHYPVPASTAPSDADNGYHKYGDCRERDHSGAHIGPVCQICAGAEPLYQAYRKTANERAGALRALVRLVKP